MRANVPNRLVKTEAKSTGGTPTKIQLAGFREAIEAELSARGWTPADLVRATGQTGKKIDDAYLRRLLKGSARFNEEHISRIADILNLPVYVGEVPRPTFLVEAPPVPNSKKNKHRADFVPIPVLPQSIVAQKPFRYDPWKVKDWAYMHWRAFQAFQIESMACVRLSMDTGEPLVRKEALICICTSARPPANQVPPASVWAARKGDDLVIGHLEERENAVLLIQKIPSYKVEAIANREDIVGQVCWVWHSMV